MEASRVWPLGGPAAPRKRGQQMGRRRDTIPKPRRPEPGSGASTRGWPARGGGAATNTGVPTKHLRLKLVLGPCFTFVTSVACCLILFRAMGSDDESMSDDGSQRTAGNMLDSVPVEIDGASVQKLRCKLCNSKATELSPLASSDDMYIKYIEWRLYHKKKLQNKIVSKVPRGRLCNWCPKTFYSLGVGR